ncbi:TIGR01458 family HAD-type hydrolase [Methylobacillus flagellatus]|uniref:TIGR01458 family HAD-type hydrolase n=1 Tax=Methylobacillus flagellatus TaxID=405 RepID=UPI0010F70AC1|nr:TIGR01458 family HAD-type hydrolase [Methylobacillus flagellatus]
MNTELTHLHGMLFDLDGVLYTGSTPIPGAIEAVARLRSSGLPCRFVTNTSTLSLHSLQHKLSALGFDIPACEIVSAPQAALRYLQGLSNPVCRLLMADDVKQDFAGLAQSDSDPDYILIGDMGERWSYRLLNEVFNSLMQGAKLIAIHKNRFWQTEHGLQLDIGAFIHGLEYASGREAMIIGKPSADFFRIALQDMQLQAAEVGMIGDDIDSDIGGAQQAGLVGILVRTGKYRAAYAAASSITPDAIIDSIADLPALLRRQARL